MGKKRRKETESKFIACPKYKNLPKKHVDVCRECKSKKGCKAYRAYQQPSLPFPHR